MALRNLVRSPVVALALASVGCAALAIALHPDDAPVAPLPSPPPPPSPPRPAPHVDRASAPPTAALPELRGLRVAAAAADRGATLVVTLELHLSPPTSPSDLITIRARCAVDGDWYDGSTSVLVDPLGPGDHTVTQQLVVGSRYRLGGLPTACHVQLESFAKAMPPASEHVFAVRCWNGRDVVDGRCDAIARPPALDLRDVRVTPTTYLRIELDAQLHRELDWSLHIAADCTLPDGTKRSDATSLPLSQTRAGKLFSDSVMLFWRAKLPAQPSACTLHFEIEDLYHLAHEPIAVRCWLPGAVQPRPCP